MIMLIIYCCKNVILLQKCLFDNFRTEEESPRLELLHNINPRAMQVGENLYPDIFDVRVQSAIRVGDYKLLTGFPGKI